MPAFEHPRLGVGERMAVFESDLEAEPAVALTRGVEIADEMDEVVEAARLDH